MESTTLFPSIPDEARLWIYAADRPLDTDEQQALERSIDSFIDDWTTHGRSVQGAAAVVEDLFLLLAATVEDGDISGCGIDASTRAIEEAAQQIGFTWLPSLQILYRDPEGVVRSCTRRTFKELAKRGEVTAQTPVFNTNLTTVGELRAGRFERPAGQSWHARAFALREEQPA